METEELHDLVGELTSNIDDLESALATLTQKPLTTTTSKLPLLDKAKLHILATYALESILFNSLRLHGIDAKSHPVFAELNRVKEYFGKIKTAEGGGAKPTSRVDKDAAGRFIKAGLAGNDRYDREREVRSVRERAGVKRKLGELGGAVGTHTRFDEAAKRIRAADEGGAEPVVGMESGEEEGEGGVAVSYSGNEQNEQRKDKLSGAEKREEKILRRQRAKEAKLSPHAADVDSTQDEDAVEVTSSKSSNAPKSSKEALDSLLDGASSKLERKSKKKKKSKGQALEDERADEMK